MAGVVYPTFVQSSKLDVAGSLTSVAPTLTGVGALNCLLLVLVSESNTIQIATSVSGGGATWNIAALTPVGVGNGSIEIWVGIGGTGGNVTVTASFGGTYTAGCLLMEVAGVAAYTPFTGIIDSSVGTSPSTGTTFSDSLTPNNPNEFMLAASWASSTETASPGSPWTTIAGPLHSGTQRYGVAYQTAATVGSQTASWTQTSSGVAGLLIICLYNNNPIGMEILNDPTSTTNAGIYAPQARPEKVDIDVIQQSLAQTGVIGGCAVSPNSNSDFNFQVGGGQIASQGQIVGVAAVSAQPITTSDPTNPRRDLVYASPQGNISYVAGAAAAIPSEPQVPYNCVALGVIDVPANAGTCDNTTSTATAHVIDRRIFVHPQLLSRAVYNPGTATTTTTTSTTFTTISGVPGLTILAPPNGRVRIMITGGGWNITSGQAGCIALTDTDGVVAGTAQVLVFNTGTAYVNTTFNLYCTLVPNSLRGYNLGWALRFGGSGTFGFAAGGDVTSTASAWGPFVQEVWTDG